MNRIGKLSVLVVLCVGVAVGTFFGTGMLSQPAAAQGGDGKGSCTVVSTDGVHLIVTDNKSQTLYFYSIEKDAEIGSELKMRGKLDLSQVGKDVLTPTIMFKKK